MLKQIKVPDSVRSFGELCFYQSGLEEIEIGAGLTEIGEGALSYCQNLQDITVDNDNAVFGSYDGVLFNAEKTKLMFYPAAKTGAYTLPKTTETIAGYAFSGASKLTEVTLNDGLIESADMLSVIVNHFRHQCSQRGWNAFRRMPLKIAAA